MVPNCDRSSKVVITLPRDAAMTIDSTRQCGSALIGAVSYVVLRAPLMMDELLADFLTAEREDYFGRVALTTAFNP